ncbi:MAG: peptide chain release factor N(5)-glutamine methyltransferase, partial [Pyrinomonadaceae bacterium]
MNTDNTLSFSIRESIFEAAQTLHQAGIPDSRREAGSLLQYVIDRDRTFIISHAEALITEEQSKSFHRCVQRRAAGEPLQYITGQQAFFGLDFEVNRDVLIPRPETEILVEIAATFLEGVKSAPFVCDVGTGSGCIAVALLDSNRRATAMAIDVSEAAIRVARRNALRHSVANRVTFVVADCFRAMRAGERFDLVISNPPYVAGLALEGLQREVRDHEPRVALT